VQRWHADCSSLNRLSNHLLLGGDIFMLKSAFVFCIAVLGITALASEAYQNEGADIQLTQIISGKTVFEKRTTVVPMALCTREPCRKPEIYWSLVVYNQETHYEVNQIFGIGSRTPPAKVALAGAEIHEGTLVEIEGRVNPISREYAIVSEISRAEVIDGSEPMDPAASNILSDAYSWMCQSPSGESPRIYANVRYLRDQKQTRPDEKNYYMAISMCKNPDGLSFLPIAELENVKSSHDDLQITYTGGDQGDGQGHGMMVELTIEKNPDRMFDLPAKLTLTHTRRAAVEDALQIYPLTCTRTRL